MEELTKGQMSDNFSIEWIFYKCNVLVAAELYKIIVNFVLYDKNIG